MHTCCLALLYMCSILNVQDDVWSRYIGFFTENNSTLQNYTILAGMLNYVMYLMEYVLCA